MESAMKYTIYIADDEKNILHLIKSFLESDGYDVVAFENGDDLFSAFLAREADLVILDVMMPGTDGLTICQKLREITDVPIIMLTAKDSELDYVQGITLGSDDYLTKPFRPTVLLMRVRALLRRVEMERKKNSHATGNGGDITLGNLRYSAEENALKCGKNQIPLSPTELKLFLYMMRKPEKAYSRDELLNEIWGFEEAVETRVTDETLRRIRKKLSESGSNVSVKTVWGYGYKLKTEEK